MRPPKLAVHPRAFGTGKMTPTRARYWSDTDMIASEGRPRPVFTPFVSRGLTR